MRYFRRLTLSQARWVGIDAAFVLALTGAALAGLGSTFTESEFWWIGMLGALLAVLELDDMRRSRILRGFNLPPAGGFA